MTSPRKQIARRLTEAGLIDDRFIRVRDGEKGSPVDHTDSSNRHSNFAALEGDYGVYAGPSPDGDTWLVDVDIDDYAEGADGDALATVTALPETFTVKSPHTDGEQGGHWYYAVECEDLDERIQALTGGTTNPKPSWGEIRVHNQYVVGPGSQLDGCDKDWCDECATDDGGRYTVATDAPIAELDAEDLLDVLRADGLDANESDERNSPAGSNQDQLDDYESADDARAEDVAEQYSKISTYLEDGAKAAGFVANNNSGDRSAADFHVCCRMLEHGVGKEQAYDLLADSSKTKVHERGRDYFRDTWQNAKRQVGAQAGAKAETDGGATTAASSQMQEPAAPNWEAVQGSYAIAEKGDIPKSQARYEASETLLSTHDFVNVRESDELYIYDPDEGIYRDRGQREVREITREGLGRFFGRVEVSEMCEHIRAVSTRPYDDLGGPEQHIPVRNGVVKLEAGQRDLIDHSPDYRFLHRAGTEYDPEAECPRWKEFLEDSIRNGAERDKLQEYVGYALYHWELPFHKGLFIVGPKASGKSTFLDVVRKLIGKEGVSNVTPQQMTERFGGAELFGKWANIRSDIPSEMINNTGEFKEIVAGDPIKAEKKHQDPFMFRPTAKHFYSANTLPDTEDDDDAFYRRILLVAFPSSVPEPEQDRKLGGKLERELPGILNWALDGLQRLVDQGGFTNDRNTGATADTWQKWGSTVDRFASVCVETGAKEPIPKKDVYRRYIRFCEQENMPAEPQRVFTRKLKTDHGVTDGKATVDGRQQRCFLNLEFTARAERYADDRDGGDDNRGTSLGNY